MAVDESTTAQTALALGAQIRERRRALGISQEDLSQLASVSLRFLGSLERGKSTVRLSALIAVCDALGLKVTLS
ncbi:MAG TPA: helix-turn-helix transcriptional regulator [Galbitalea sp.]|jgi:y4mF family transcriptional regulator|nr:helix-turn-helix transcriptional regulator [Galbitalea sp.]